MKHMKKYPLLVAGILTFAVLIGSSALFIKLSTSPVVTLERLEGDPKILEDVVLSGAVTDNQTHMTYFTLEKEKWKQQTAYLTNDTNTEVKTADKRLLNEKQERKSRDNELKNALGHTYDLEARLFYRPTTVYKIEEMEWKEGDDTSDWKSSYQYGLGEAEDTQRIKRRGTTDEVKVYIGINGSSHQANKASYFYGDRAFLIETELYLKTDEPSIRFTEYELKKQGEKSICYAQNYESAEVGLDREGMGKQQQGLVVLKDKFYFTPIVGKAYTGSSGIYCINSFYEYPYSYATYGNEVANYRDLLMPKGEGVKICDINLEEQDKQILGLEAVDEQLILILLEEKKLTLKSYSTEGHLLDTYYLGEYEDLNYDTAYEACSEENRLTLMFRPKQSAKKGKVVSLFGIEVNELGKIEATPRTEYTSSSSELFSPIYMTTVEGKIFVFEEDSRAKSKTFYSKLQMDSFNQDDFTAASYMTYLRNLIEKNESIMVYSPRIFLSVYENATLCYKGYLDTPVVEDRIYESRQTEGTKSYLPRYLLERLLKVTKRGD